jgi:hypothetical protein
VKVASLSTHLVGGPTRVSSILFQKFPNNLCACLLAPMFTVSRDVQELTLGKPWKPGSES